MKTTRIVFLLLVSLALAACSGEQAPPTALGSREAPVSPASGEVGQSVTGSALVQVFAPAGIGLRRLTFTARVFPDGAVDGEWNLVAGSAILHGDIDCLHILPDGKTARLSGIVTDAKFTLFVPGTAFAMEFVDNGQGGDADADVTTDLRAFRNASPEVGRLFCETGEAPPDVEYLQMIHGNFQVRGD
jgi:hypothetical protein